MSVLAFTLVYKLIDINAPQGKIMRGKLAYEDDSLAVYSDSGQYLVCKKGGNTKWVAIPASGDDIEKVTVLKNKPACSSPLHGVAITEGIKIVDTREAHIVKIVPDLELLASYPNPGTNDDKILIDKGNNVLYLYKSGELYKIFQVATGKDPSFTPEGEFIIKNKLNNHDLSGSLGVRWLGLGVPVEKDNRVKVNDDRAPKGLKYGIHGTYETVSIGKHASEGCVRMTNEDVKELYSLVKIGTMVEITVLKPRS